MWSIGVDIVDVNRFRKKGYENHRKFYERVFTAREIEYCLTFNNLAEHFAATFAGKEAVYKAVCSYIDINLRDIEILRKDGTPYVNLITEGCEARNESESRINVKVSLSHCSSYAVAFAIATTDGKQELRFKKESK
jgi:holo-[acyl-carrier protein] synthase